MMDHKRQVASGKWVGWTDRVIVCPRGGKTRGHKNVPTLLLLVVMLNACSTAPKTTTSLPSDSGFGKGDAAPSAPLDVASIPEPTPRVEPLGKYGNPPSYTVNGQTYRTLTSSAGYVERGTASWYGTKFHGRRTSSGEPYDMYAMSAAHKTLPLPSYVRVTNLQNGRSLIVRVNDRGPFIDNRLIDLSYAAATKLGILDHGTGLVEVRALSPDAPEETSPATKLYIQAGAFQSLDNAERLRTQLLDKIVDEIEIIKTRLNDTVLYRVRIGPMANLDDAGRLTKTLTRSGINGARIVVD